MFERVDFLLKHGIEIQSGLGEVQRRDVQSLHNLLGRVLAGTRRGALGREVEGIDAQLALPLPIGCGLRRDLLGLL